MAKDIDALVERSKEVIDSSNQVAKRYNDLVDTHLHFVLRLYAKELGELSQKIKSLQKSLSKRSSKLNSLEVEFLRRINRQSEEVEFIEEVFAHFHASGKKESEVIAFGLKLVNEAKQLLNKPGLKPFQERYLKDDITDVERLIGQLRKATTGKVYSELPLIDKLRSLRALIYEIIHDQE